MRVYNIFIALSCFLISVQSCQKTDGNTMESKGLEVSQQAPINPSVKMVTIKGGDYLPFYSEDSAMVHVDDFLIDERPVTNAEFLDFVKKNPQWKRSNIKPIYADDTYLRDWQDDETLPKNADPEAPVTFVSWFAAKAYAKSAGKRLPTLDEWEYVAMADEVSPNARQKASYSANIINLYNVKYREKNKVMQSKPNYWGVYNMFDLVWEWTYDFNSVLVTNDNRESGVDDKGQFCAGAATTSTDVLNYASFMRFASRASLKANYTVENVGFRCAKDIKEKQ